MKKGTHSTAVLTIEELIKRWDEGLANQERLKKLLPFLNEDDGYF